MKKFFLSILLVFAFSWTGFSQIKKEVKIGKQVWMTQNLNIDKFRNGDTIPEAKTIDEWRAAHKNEKPAWCYYNDDPANGDKYGKLYNWYAVVDPRGIAPEGWHVPSDSEFKILKEFLGFIDIPKPRVYDGGWMKMINPKDWMNNMHCSLCNNSSGLTLLPGGKRFHDGEFSGFGFEGHWWSSTKYEEMHTYDRQLSDGYGFVNYGEDIRAGLSIRCIKD